jgi:hypothetical protein
MGPRVRTVHRHKPHDHGQSSFTPMIDHIHLSVSQFDVFALIDGLSLSPPEPLSLRVSQIQGTQRTRLVASSVVEARALMCLEFANSQRFRRR